MKTAIDLRFCFFFRCALARVVFLRKIGGKSMKIHVAHRGRTGFGVMCGCVWFFPDRVWCGLVRVGITSGTKRTIWPTVIVAHLFISNLSF